MKRAGGIAVVVVALLFGWLLVERQDAGSGDGDRRRPPSEALSPTTGLSPAAVLRGTAREAAEVPASATDRDRPGATASVAPAFVLDLRVDGDRVPDTRWVWVDGIMADLDHATAVGEGLRIPLPDGARVDGARVLVEAQGFLPGHGTIRAGTSPLPRASVTLVEGGRLLVHGRPEERFVVLNLQVWTTTWASLPSEVEEHANGSRTHVGLPAGRYRIVERFSGFVSEGVDVAPGRESEIHLGLGETILMVGRIEAPPGVDLRAARVDVVRPGAAPLELRAHLLGSRAWSERQVAEDGAYRVRGRAGERVLLTVVHPVLRAAEGSRDAVATIGRDAPVLRLEPGPEIRFRLPWYAERGADPSWMRNQGSGLVNEPRVRLVRVDGEGSDVRELRPYLDAGVFRVGVPTPGRWRLFVDPGFVGPATSRDVDVGEGVVDLGLLASPTSSRIRVHVRPANGDPSPSIEVVARGVEPFEHERHSTTSETTADGRRVHTVEALGAGRFVVSITQEDNWSRTIAGPVERTVELDGVHDAEVGVGLVLDEP